MTMAPLTAGEREALLERIPPNGARVTLERPLRAEFLDWYRTGMRLEILPAGTTIEFGEADLPVPLLPGSAFFTRDEIRHAADLDKFLEAIGPNWRERQAAIDAVNNPNQARLPVEEVQST